MTGRTLDLYVHTLGQSEEFERGERILERLETLSTAGVIDDYRVTVWGDGLVFPSHGRNTGPGRRMAHQLLVCQHWCLANGADTDPLFTTDNDEMSETSVDVAPVVLCEYVGTRLAFVSPYEDDRRSAAVEDHLGTLENGGRLVARTDAVRIEDPARSGRAHVATHTERTARKTEQSHRG